MSRVLATQLHSFFRGAVVVVSLLFILVASCASRSSPAQRTPQDSGTRHCSDSGFSLPQSCVGGSVLLTAPDNLYTTFAVLAEPQANVVCHWSCRSTRDPDAKTEPKHFHGPWRLDDSDVRLDRQGVFLLFKIASAPHAPAKLVRMFFDHDFRMTNAQLANTSAKTITEYRLGWIYENGNKSTIGEAHSIALPPATSRPTGYYDVPTNLYGADKGTVTFYVAYVLFEDGDHWQVTVDDIKDMRQPDSTKSTPRSYN